VIVASHRQYNPMPTLIPYAKPAGPHCLQALPELRLPNLSSLLHLLTAGTRQTCEEDSLTPLFERLHAQALGLTDADGLLPWAALDAAQLQLPAAPDGHGWAWLTPCHWQVNSDHVRMAHLADLHTSDAELHTLLDAMRGFFAEDGITVHALQGGHWLASGAAFYNLPTASLSRAAGGAVDHWMPRQEQARPLRRLQNEMQMLLYSHPVNDARSAAGQLTINSFWVSGTGSAGATAPAPAHSTTLINALQEAALRDDAAAWTQAWQALDAGPIAELLHEARVDSPVALTLCADNSARTFSLQAQGLWSRMRHRFASTDAIAVLQDI